VAVVALGLAAAAAGSGPALASGTRAGAHTAVAGPARPSAVPGGTKLWIDRFDGGTGRSAEGSSVAVSPDGSVVYVSGISYLAGTYGTDRHLLTVAYKASTGARLWTANYTGGTNHPGGNTFEAVSPDGSTVYVGSAVPQPGQARFQEYLTVSYSAATGARKWVTTTVAEYQATGLGMVLSPDGSALYLTGLGGNGVGKVYYETVSLNAATGSQNWESSSASFSTDGDQTASYIAVSPDGSHVFVVGQAGVVALNAATGTQLWADPYSLASDRRFQSLAVSPDSSTLYVTGKGKAYPADGYVTTALNASTGATIWRATAPGESLSEATSVAVSPGGSTVFVTGSLTDGTVTTIAYNAATGKRLWRSSHGVGQQYVGATMALVTVSPDGAAAYVLTSHASTTGQYAYLVIAYNASTGARLWTSKLAGPSTDSDYPAAITSTTDGVYATGYTEIPSTSGPDTTLMTTIDIQP
jgi:outer membrane protein assembly factor BamB